MQRRWSWTVAIVILLPILYLVGGFPVFYARGRWQHVPVVRSSTEVYLVPYYWALDRLPGFRQLGPALYAGSLRRGAEASRAP